MRFVPASRCISHQGVANPRIHSRLPSSILLTQPVEEPLSPRKEPEAQEPQQEERQPTPAGEQAAPGSAPADHGPMAEASDVSDVEHSSSSMASRPLPDHHCSPGPEHLNSCLPLPRSPRPRSPAPLPQHGSALQPKRRSKRQPLPPVVPENVPSSKEAPSEDEREKTKKKARGPRGVSAPGFSVLPVPFPAAASPPYRASHAQPRRLISLPRRRRKRRPSRPSRPPSGRRSLCSPARSSPAATTPRCAARSS